MERFARSRSRPHVVIAGGGFAGLETLLALWVLGREHVRVTLVAPTPTLFYRPAATAEAFEGAAARTYDLNGIASDLGAAFAKARLVSVASHKRYLRLSSGGRLVYDALVLATGARATAGVAGALMFRDQRDVPAFRRALREVEREPVRRMVFALPAGTSWPLPLYELALLSANYTAERHLATEITLVTPEREPLEVFGVEPSRLVESVLAEHRVSFIGDSAPDHVCDDGSLALQSGRTIEADRVVAAPRLHGRPIAGVPTNPRGFVPTDASGRVSGLEHVYAAGDATTFPIKQGGVAAQQADRVAQAILSAAGTAVIQRRIPSVLQARLIGGKEPLFLRAELDEQGHATSATLTRTSAAESVVDNKVLARYLTPYLEQIRSAAPVEN
jgi:sulfide:quinone oxidoreductase